MCKSLPPPFIPRIASDEDVTLTRTLTLALALTLTLTLSLNPTPDPDQVSNFEENSGPDFGDFTLTDIAAGLF